MPRLGEHFKYPKYRIMKECSASEKKLFGIDHFYEACDIFWFFLVCLYHKQTMSKPLI